VRVKTPDDASSYIYQSLKLPDSGWTIHRLADMSTVHQDQRDGAIIGGAVSALVISLLLYLLQRQRAYLAERNAGVRLKEEVAERTQELSEANASLRTEIEERRRTEARLRAMQNELVQAGKLAALGQMSAAIAHEINQPLAAIRTFMASTRIFAKRGDNAQVASNLDLINDLAERMANITAHLKTFARKSEPGRPEIVSIDRAIDGALFLIDGQIRAAGVRIEKDVEPHLQVRGYAVQLEQVMVNLIGNALDAVANATQPWIRIEAHARDASVTISVADNGSGFTTENVDRIFDPFYTTKPIGKGLGLGLSISYGIVQDFGGQIHAANRPEGGARVTVELPLLAREAALVAKAAHA
jgi:two-component system C4-dicarboxylate transport sensor histidine kinase DctB